MPWTGPLSPTPLNRREGVFFWRKERRFDMRVYGPIILWSLGVALALAGELWAVFDGRRGNTITESFFRHWTSLSAMGALLVWASYHFFFSKGKTSNVDFAFIGAGFLGGLLAWFFNRPPKPRLRKKNPKQP